RGRGARVDGGGPRHAGSRVPGSPGSRTTEPGAVEGGADGRPGGREQGGRGQVGAGVPPPRAEILGPPPDSIPGADSGCPDSGTGGMLTTWGELRRGPTMRTVFRPFTTLAAALTLAASL